MEEEFFLKKSERRIALVEFLARNPFATDEQLAEHFSVSIPTIRLDRAALKIPEARERIRRLAAGDDDPVRSLERDEIVGEVVRLQLNRYAVSRLRTVHAHAFARSGIVRGHVLFGQVNSLAVAVIDADEGLTAKTQLRFYRPVHVGEILEGRVDVVAIRSGVTKCKVLTQVADETVLDGMIWVVSSHLGLMSEVTE